MPTGHRGSSIVVRRPACSSDARRGQASRRDRQPTGRGCHASPGDRTGDDSRSDSTSGAAGSLGSNSPPRVSGGAGRVERRPPSVGRRAPPERSRVTPLRGCTARIPGTSGNGAPCERSLSNDPPFPGCEGASLPRPRRPTRHSCRRNASYECRTNDCRSGGDAVDQASDLCRDQAVGSGCGRG